MPGQKDRVILDTNIWISLLLTNDFLKLEELISGNSITLILSNELLEEIIDVTQRPKFKRYFDLNTVGEFILKIQDIADIIDVVSNISLCRDPKDDFLLELAIDGKATHLITGDKDLLVLKSIEKTRILTLSDYLSAK